MYNFTFSPHNLTRNEVSAPQQFRMVGVMGYNVLMFRDPSLHAACVGGDCSFGRIAPGRLGLKMMTGVN